MFRVAYMLYAQDNCCKCCDGSLFDLSEQDNARKYKDVSLFKRCVSNMDYICFV